MGWLEDYMAAGFGLCAIKPGTKQPRGTAWQKAPIKKEPPPGYGLGIVHAHSGTCSLDLDDIDGARICLEALGVDLDQLLRDGVQILSREGRGKLLYKAPPDLPDQRHNLNWPDKNGPSKKNCIIEFRAGLTQDVLPPSIHPDTGHPYTWGGDWRNLPELPDRLVKAWQEWPLAKQAMQDACPWAVETPIKAPMIPRAVASGDNDVIGSFNRAHQPGMILEANGYIKSGKRWLSPHSSTQIPGVVQLDDDKIYCHHGSDPLGDGYSHDAFSVYTSVEHNGDVTAAVKEAAAMLGMDKQEETPDTDTKAMAKLLQFPPTPKRQDKTEAKRPGVIPCRELQQAQKWIAASLPAHKPDAVTMAVISFAMAMTARRYTTPDGNPTTFFAAICDSSVAGIRPVKDAVYALATAAGERRMLRGTKLNSAGLLYKSLHYCPRMLWITDEYGHMVHMSRIQQSGAIENVLSALHDAYAGKRLYIDMDEGKTDDHNPDQNDVLMPSVHMLALMSEPQLGAISKKSEYGRGTLQQMLVVPAGDAVDYSEVSAGDPPRDVLEKIYQIAKGKLVYGAAESHAVAPNAVPVKMASEAKSVIDDYRSRMVEYMQDDDLTQFRGMAHGYLRTAYRLMSGLAAWVSPDDPVITQEVAEWSMQWVYYCMTKTGPLLAVSGQGADPDVVDNIQRILMDFGTKGATERELVKRCRDLRRMSGGQDGDRQRVLYQMHEDGLLQIGKTKMKTNKYFDKSVPREVVSRHG